jgi:hypothetical protein
MDDHVVMTPEQWEKLSQSKPWSVEDYIHGVGAVMTTTIRASDGRQVSIDSTLSSQDLELSPESFILRISTPVAHRLLNWLKSKATSV